MDHIIGVISTGIDCDVATPSKYAAVGAHRTWIFDMTKIPIENIRDPK